MKKIREVIVAEGKDDRSAILRAVDADVITTSGFGLNDSSLALIKKAYEERGIVILTDPDHAGMQIRRRLTALFPDAAQAYIARDDAQKSGDIGVENASPSAIEKALENAKVRTAESPDDPIEKGDLVQLGLCGRKGSALLRDEVGKILGIGSGNTNAFLKRLNTFGITRKQLRSAWENCSQKKE